MSLFLFYSAPVDGVRELRQRVRFIRAAVLFCTDCAGGTSCVSNTPLTGGAFFAEPQRVGSCRAPRGDKRVDTCGFYPLVPLPGRQVRFASHAENPAGFLMKSSLLIFAKCVHGHIRTIKSGKNFRRFLMLFGMKLIFSKVLKRLCFYVQSIQCQNEKEYFLYRTELYSALRYNSSAAII